MTKCVKANVSVLATLAGVEEQTVISAITAVNTSKSFNVVTTKNTIQITPVGSQMSGIIEIYNFKGELIKTITNTGNIMVWDARDSNGKFAKKGLYIFKADGKNINCQIKAPLMW